jgi:nickel-dependent lactate racemase
MKVDIHYGDNIVSLEVPEVNIAHIIRPWQDEEETDNSAILQQALTGPEVENFREAIASRRLCVLLDDGTRDEPFGDIFEQLFPVLQLSSFVRFVLCTGTHEPATPQNNQIATQIQKAAAKAQIGNYEIHAHDCEHATLAEAGVTSLGTVIVYNTLADDADVFLVLSDVKVHYFAGYSNPIKNFVPGICTFRTTEQNHSLALDDKSTFGVHPWHQDSNRRNNPLACDQLEGMQLIVKERPIFTLATITTSRQIRWAKFGPIESVSTEAFATVDQRNTHTVTPVGRLIISPGGLPNDIDLYIAQRALELTKDAITDGGEILFLAACPNGVGEVKTMENFYHRLTMPIENIFKSIESEYKLYSHKPYKFARLIQRLRRIHIYTQIPDDIVRAAHLCPAHNPQAVVDDWLTEQPDAKIIIVDGANKIALYST